MVGPIGVGEMLDNIVLVVDADVDVSDGREEVEDVYDECENDTMGIFGERDNENNDGIKDKVKDLREGEDAGDDLEDK
jgi:hypothetical protein